MTSFVALYKGRTISDAELVALSADPSVVSKLFEELMGQVAPEVAADRSDLAPVAPVPRPIGEDE